MIRKAVGAIIVQNGEYLLVNKKLSVSTNEVLHDHWDFPKGAVEPRDKDHEAAILRELHEETGSLNYKILHEFDSKICFDFPPKHKFHSQETRVFYVEFTGSKSELKADGKEIGEIAFFSKEEFFEKIKLEETRKFLCENAW